MMRTFFVTAWEQRKFEDLYDYASEGGTPDTNNPAFYEGGKIPFVKIEDTVEKYIDSPKSYITEEGMNHSSAWLIPKGNVIFTNGATVGNVAINRLPVTTKQGILGIIPSKKVTSEFLFYLLSSTEFQREVRSRMATGTFATIILKSLNEIPVCFPSNTNEQESIITILSRLDNLITLHQRKYDKLVNIKKSCLEKMFPKNGSSVPEIRFAGFTEAWEQCKLGDVCQVTMGQSPDGSTYSDTPSDYILVQGNADLNDGWVSPRIWTTQKTKTAEAGDLIMSVRAPAGSMGKTSYNVVLGRGVAGIKGNEFIYQSLVKMDSDGYWKKLAAGSTFESINSDVVNGAELIVPQDIDEQNKIGDYFASIDNLITLHQRELEKLKNIKKACLEKMFV